MKLKLVKIQYDPASSQVSLLLQHKFGQLHVHTSEAELCQHRIKEADPMAWGNAEALLEAQAKVNKQFPDENCTVTL